MCQVELARDTGRLDEPSCCRLLKFHQCNFVNVMHGCAKGCVMVPPVAVTDMTASVSERAEAILAFERAWWQYAGAKEDAIAEHFGLSSSAYYQLLNALLDDEAAQAFDPLLVKRLKRQRAQRQRERAASRTASSR